MQIVRRDDLAMTPRRSESQSARSPDGGWAGVQRAGCERIRL